MGIKKLVESSIEKMPPWIIAGVFKCIKPIPMVKNRIQREYNGIMKELESVVKPYKDSSTNFLQIPEAGINSADILYEMEKLESKEASKWKHGFVSGAVYHGDDDHIGFLNKVYAINSQSNPLHSDVFPSSAKYESEVVSMTAHMLKPEDKNRPSDPDQDICGVVTSGGTESILLAMKTYRDWAHDQKGINKPEMIIPSTAHAAFDKASQYFNVKCIRIPVDNNYRADVTATRKAITRNTIVIVGSAPSFPHGIIDPIEELSELAIESKAGFHTDACLGGFILPWAKKLGYDIPPFDFTLPGVTSISADTHKYGYAPKGTSVILYRGFELRHYQYYKTTEWPGGLYCSPTFAGSRPGALSAGCWATMVAMGANGYLEATKRILQTASTIKTGINQISDLYTLGDPLWVIAFGSNVVDIYKVIEFMSDKGWNLNALHKPSCAHICVTLRHTQPEVSKRFVDDLKSAVEHVKQNPDEKGSMAPVYGMAAKLPVRGIVGDLLERYMDLLYKA